MKNLIENMTRVLGIVFITGILVACYDYTIQLPNNYQLINVGGDARVIIDPDKIVITEIQSDGTVDLYAVCGGYVTGKLVLYSQSEYKIIKSGFFILDTLNNTITKELSETQFKNNLASFGIMKVKLRRPNNISNDTIDNKCN